MTWVGFWIDTILGSSTVQPVSSDQNSVLLIPEPYWKQTLKRSFCNLSSVLVNGLLRWSEVRTISLSHVNGWKLKSSFLVRITLCLLGMSYLHSWHRWSGLFFKMPRIYINRFFFMELVIVQVWGLAALPEAAPPRALPRPWERSQTQVATPPRVADPDSH